MIFYSDWCLVELGIKFWKISIFEAQDTWRVVVAPRGSCLKGGVCMCEMLVRGHVAMGSHLVAEISLLWLIKLSKRKQKKREALIFGTNRARERERVRLSFSCEREEKDF